MRSYLPADTYNNLIVPITVINKDVKINASYKLDTPLNESQFWTLDQFRRGNNPVPMPQNDVYANYAIINLLDNNLTFPRREGKKGLLYIGYATNFVKRIREHITHPTSSLDFDILFSEYCVEAKLLNLNGIDPLKYFKVILLQNFENKEKMEEGEKLFTKQAMVCELTINKINPNAKIDICYNRKVG